MTRPESFYRPALALVIGTLVFLLIVYTLEKTGVPRQYSLAASAVFGLIVLIATLLSAGSTRAERFFYDDRKLGNAAGALAVVGIAGFPLIVFLGGAAFMIVPGFLVTLVVAVCGGLALSGLAATRHFNARGASDIAELLLHDRGGKLGSRLFASGMAFPGLIFAASGILAGAFLLQWFFALSGTMAVSLFCTGCFLIAVLGGMRSLLRFSAVAAGLFLLALNLPLFIHTVMDSGFPIGHLAAGYGAIEPVGELEAQLRSLGIAQLDDRMQIPTTVFNWGQGTQILAAIIVMVATASLPALVHVASASSNTDRAGHVLQRGMLYFGLAGASLIALMAFTKIGFYQTNLGLTLAEARVEAPYLYSWDGREAQFVQLCGQMISSADALAQACGGGSDHILNLPDFFLESRLMLVGSAEISGLPFAFTALLSLSVIALLAAFTSASILSTAEMLITAFYFSLPGKVASGRVFMVRTCLLAMLGIAMFASERLISDPGTAFMLAVSYSATLCATALAGAIHLPNIGKASFASALGVGFAICTLYYVLSLYGIDFVPGTGDELLLRFPGMGDALPPELGGVIALPVAIGILILIQLFASQGRIGESDEADATKDSLSGRHG